MKNGILKFTVALVLILIAGTIFADYSFAQETAAPAAAAAPDAASTDARGKLLFISALSAAIAIGVAAAGTGIAQGNAVAKAMEAIGRNPESQKKIFPTLIIGLAFIESLALYALLVSLALLFFNPLVSQLR